MGIESTGLTPNQEQFRNHNIHSSDFRERLGVVSNATKEEVKRAFRELSRLYHPDIGGDTEASKNLGEAYAALKDDGLIFYRPESGYAKSKSEKVEYQKVGSYFFQNINPRSEVIRFVNPATGEQYGDNYFEIKTMDGLYIADGCLVDPDTGKKISESYSSLKVVDEKFLVGFKYDFSKLIDRNTGKEIGDGFEEVQNIGPYAIALDKITSSGWHDKQRAFFIDYQTGTRYGEKYKSIKLIGEKYFIGIDHSGRLCLLDPSTGKVIGKGFSEVERTDQALIANYGPYDKPFFLIDEETGKQKSDMYKKILPSKTGNFLIGLQDDKNYYVRNIVLLDPQTGREMQENDQATFSIDRKIGLFDGSGQKRWKYSKLKHALNNKKIDISEI